MSKVENYKRDWVFWIDCGGTFTDIIAHDGAGNQHVHKILSHSPHYKSAVAQGIEDIIGHNQFSSSVKEVRLGTTVATNAFLERQGVDCALVTTLGHKDVLKIRQQNRSTLFDIPLRKGEVLQKVSTQVYERINSKGEVLIDLDEEIAEFELKRILEKGIKSLAVSLLHANVNPSHELKLGEIAKSLGFEYVALSHQVSPVKKYVARTETTVLDSYLSPFLSQYTEELTSLLGIEEIFYMQSNGGLCLGHQLKGYNALLSGPAGGLIGAVEFAKEYGHEKILTFDMGGTSTDVAIYDGELSIDHEPIFHGHQLLAPMVDIHTVAAGGGSILTYDEGRFKVGPESAKAYPGPACYRNGGPLTVTDANLYLGNLKVEQFPKVFGKERNQPLDETIVREKFEKLAQEIGMDPIEVARGFLDVAVETMARAVKRVSIERGHDPSEFTLISFGGAGGQLAALVAEKLGVNKILIHPLCSVLSAYGMGKASYALDAQGNIEDGFEVLQDKLNKKFKGLSFKESKFFLMGAKDSDFQIQIKAPTLKEAKKKFKSTYESLFELDLQEEGHCSTIILKGEALGTKNFKEKSPARKTEGLESLQGPKLISENNTTILIPKGWQGTFENTSEIWTLQKCSPETVIQKHDERVELEIFYQRFQFIAEQMGVTLQRMSKSVNIKERKDFSCALFTDKGELIANAPHIPVHLGSMGDVVGHIIQEVPYSAGDMFLCNSPLSGGTHLPDLTVVAPVYFEGKLAMWVASRGHHADIGGTSPGSMPGNSKNLYEEGVVIEPTLIVKDGKVLESKLEEILLKTKYPVRNYNLNLHDIKAKVSANKSGASQLLSMIENSGAPYVLSMAEKVLDYSHRKISNVLSDFKASKGSKKVTADRELVVSFYKEKDKTVFDFSGTSPRVENNFNTPIAVVKASVLFVLRCLIDEDIPLNSGIMRSIELKIPEDCFLNPHEESAVVSGNVETSQALCDVLFYTLGVMANSQGTMNNLSFGNDIYQYYETLAGGSGATCDANGTSSIQVHMTNSLLTDPEVFESRFPVLIELMGEREGSGGQGQFLGGNGISRRLRFLEDMNVNMISQSRNVPPLGLDGGESGQRGKNRFENEEGFFELPECFDREFRAGEVLFIDTPGGGGYGSPKKGGTAIFSFGSNLDILQIKTRCPDAELLFKGTAYDKELRYSLYAEGRDGGVADLLDAKGKVSYGLVVKLNDKDLETLDGIECGISHYKRIELEFFDDNGNSYQGYCYDVIDKRPDIAPSKYYEWLIYSGAYQLNVPQSYLGHIKSFREV